MILHLCGPPGWKSGLVGKKEPLLPTAWHLTFLVLSKVGPAKPALVSFQKWEEDDPTKPSRYASHHFRKQR